MSSDISDHFERDDERHPNAHGLPTSYELAVRLERVEQQQDHVVEKVDEIAEKIDESVATNAQVDEVSETVDEHAEVIDKHHFAYRVSRLLLAAVITLLSSSVIAGLVL